VAVIEHNLDVTAWADGVIDLRPGTGQEGGTVQFESVPTRSRDERERALRGPSLAL
jgi:excinuclease UvrABC ATPase subunit